MRCDVTSSKQGGSPTAHFKAIDMPEAVESVQPEDAETEPESEDRVQEDSAPQPSKPSRLPDGRLECEFCGRKFNPTSYARHQPVCQKVFGKTRPQFLPVYAVTKAPAAARGAGVGREPDPGPQATQAEAKRGQRQQLGAAAASTVQEPIQPTLPSRASRKIFASASEAWGAAWPKGDDDLEEKEQRVRQVMDVQMEEIRNMRQQAREDSEEPPAAPPEPDSDGQTSPSAARSSSHCGTSSQPGREEMRQSVGGLQPQGTSPHPELERAAAPAAHERARRSSYRHEETPLPENDRRKDTPKGSPTNGRGVTSPSTSELQLMACEDCGRRFNPASLQRHRAVCRSVFGGKHMRSTFESQSQRLRDVKDKKECAGGSRGGATCDAVGRDRRNRGSMPSNADAPAAQAGAACPASAPASKQEVGTPGTQCAGAPCEQVEQRPTRGKCVAERSAQDTAVTTPRRSALRQSTLRSTSELQPCLHCGRSFRPAVVEKHAKVCQSVFSMNGGDVKRHVYNSRQHRGKGAPVEGLSSRPSGHSTAEGAFTPRGASASERRVSSTPPRLRGDRLVKSSASSTSVRTAERGLAPGSPEPAHRVVSDALEPQTAQGIPSNLDIWEQEVQEAIQAMSGPNSEDIAGVASVDLQASLPNSSPLHGGLRALEERATLLERARLGVKMGQRPQQALAGSMSETILRQTSDRASDATATTSFTASSLWKHGAGSLLTVTADTPQASLQAACRHSDALSKTQPAVPSMVEAPLSSRSSYRVIEASPSRRFSLDLSGQAAPNQAASGLRLPLKRRDCEGSRPARNSAQPSQAFRSGLGREDPAPPSRSADARGSLAVEVLRAPPVACAPLVQPLSGASRLSSAASQQTPRQRQVPVIPAAPPPSPASPTHAVVAADSFVPSTPRLTQTAAKGSAQSSLQHPVVVQTYAPVYRMAPSRVNAPASSTPMRERASVLVPQLDLRKIVQK